jgi:hypothetical protein
LEGSPGSDIGSPWFTQLYNPSRRGRIKEGVREAGSSDSGGDWRAELRRKSLLCGTDGVHMHD